jgi:hypothetical protein
VSEKDIIFLIGIAMGFIGGFSLGHLRGQCVGIAWLAKLRDENTALKTADRKQGE